MTVEKLFDSRKVPWLWESFLVLKKLLDCGKIDQRKFTILPTEKIIGLKFLKTNASVEIIKISFEFRAEI